MQEDYIYIPKKLFILLCINFFIVIFILIFTQIGATKNQTAKTSAAQYSSPSEILPNSIKTCPQLLNGNCISQTDRCINGHVQRDISCSPCLMLRIPDGQCYNEKSRCLNWTLRMDPTCSKGVKPSEEFSNMQPSRTAEPENSDLLPTP